MNKVCKILSLAALFTGLTGCFQNEESASVDADSNQNFVQAENAHPSSQRATPHSAADPHMNLGPDQYAMVALGHLDEGRIEEAMASVNKAINLHPDSAALFAVRAQIYAQKNEQTMALADLEQAVNLDAQNPNHYVNRATVYSKFDRDDQAMADLDKAITLNPDLLAARFNRGSLRFIQEDHQGALEDFEHCIAIDPHTAAPYFNRAAVYDAMGERAQAVSDLERFLQLAQESAWKDAAQNLLESWNKETGQEAESNS